MMPAPTPIHSGIVTPPVSVPAVRTLSLALAAAVLALGADAQAQTRPHAYSASADTVYVTQSNPHRMYWVIDDDTLGQPIHSVSLDAQLWSRSGDTLIVRVRKERLLPERSEQTDSLVLRRDGRVLSVNGQPAGQVKTRVDLVPVLPNRPLREGLAWSDTLDVRTHGAGGEQIFRVVRRYSVRAITADGRAELSAEGEVSYRDGWWTDSTETAALVLDVSGPLRESAVLDLSAGRLLSLEWTMDLRGTSTLPDGRTVPAGLLSGSRERQIGARAAADVRRDPDLVQQARLPP